MTNTMPGDAEAAAAVTHIHEQTPSGFRQGQYVRVPKAFGSGYQLGTICARETDKHLGTVWRVDTPEGRLVLLPAEIEVV